ncbi:hypothetical protein J2T17_006151, partial [Paenibacillus mucilaginosus]
MAFYRLKIGLLDTFFSIYQLQYTLKIYSEYG